MVHAQGEILNDITLNQAAKILGVTCQTVRRMVADGILTAITVDTMTPDKSRYRVSRQDVLALLQKQQLERWGKYRVWYK